jgi:uncharacterized integral membrane protein
VVKSRAGEGADVTTDLPRSEQNPESAEPEEPHALSRTRSSRPAPTRLSGAWTAVVVTAVLLVAFVIFVAENSRSVPVAYLGAQGHAPVAVLVLASAAAGALLVIVVGIARLAQLRRRSGTGRRVRHDPVVPPS